LELNCVFCDFVWCFGFGFRWLYDHETRLREFACVNPGSHQRNAIDREGIGKTHGNAIAIEHWPDTGTVLETPNGIGMAKYLSHCSYLASSCHCHCGIAIFIGVFYVLSLFHFYRATKRTSDAAMMAMPTTNELVTKLSLGS
jgi:hypothetical protein